MSSRRSARAAAPTSVAPSPSSGAADATSTGVPTPPVEGSVSPEASLTSGETERPELETTEVPNPVAQPGSELVQLETIDQSTGAPVPPLIGLEKLGALALTDGPGSGEEPRANADQDGDPDQGQCPDPTVDLGAFVRSVLEAAADQLGITYDQIASVVVVSALTEPDPFAEPGDDASGARTDLPPIDDSVLERALASYRPLAMPGLPVLFREKNRRFNGSPTTPAIVTRVLEDLTVNLMVLPDGGEPYPRMGVPYEADLDPDGLGRAWSHLKIPDLPDDD